MSSINVLKSIIRQPERNNILFDCPNIDDFKEELCEYFSEESRVAVVAFSFYDDFVFDKESWERVYGRGIGNCYFETVDPLSVFGGKEENISFINYFTDTKETAKEKIKNANVIYFTGGLPDRMMDRIEEFELTDTTRDFPISAAFTTRYTTSSSPSRMNPSDGCLTSVTCRSM